MAVAGRKTVELFYDCVSPYSWIAFETLCRYRQKWNIELKFKPVFLGGIMKGADNKPPGTNPAKGAYMAHDIVRLREHYNIPIQIPSNFAKSVFEGGSKPITMRFVTAIDLVNSSVTEALSRELWMRVWSRDQDIVDPKSLAEAGRAVGLSESVISDALVSVNSDKVKDRLKSYTQQALDYGAFGAPTIVVEDKNGHKQMVFGSDRMDIIADLLGFRYEGPLNHLSAKL